MSKRMSIKLEGIVNSFPSFQGTFFSIPIKVENYVITEETSLTEQDEKNIMEIPEIRFVQAPVLPIFTGDKIMAYIYNTGKEIPKVAHCIELVDEKGIIRAKYFDTNLMYG